jgi:hypothetical protein
MKKTEQVLSGIEDGNMSPYDCYLILEQLDPLIIYFVLRYLREKYPHTHPQSQGVMARIIEITNTYPDIVKKAQKGEKDSLREWFDDAYNMRQFFADPEGFVELIVEKVEG